MNLLLEDMPTPREIRRRDEFWFVVLCVAVLAAAALAVWLLRR